MLVSSLRGRVRVVTLDEDQGWDLIGALQAAEIAGGRSYDALIAACAQAAGAARLLTFNARDFAAVAPDLDLIVP
jgi:predicted nucleic acid-binding protein